MSGRASACLLLAAALFCLARAQTGGQHRRASPQPPKPQAAKPCWQAGIPGAVSDLTCTKATLGRYMTRDEALVVAQDIRKNFADWTDYLPDCPRRAPEDDPRWSDASDAKNRLDCFHPGAAKCFRSAHVYASPSNFEHCQQCCYNGQDELIKEGPAAGTPDFRCSGGPSQLIDSDHCFYDVMPWTALGWAEYNKVWRPNQGMLLVPGNQRHMDAGLAVRKGDVLAFNADARFRVVWTRATRFIGGIPAGTNALDSGPEGYEDDPISSLFNSLLKPPPLPTFPYAGLIGYVRRADGTLSAPFPVSVEGVITMPDDGDLLLGINDPEEQDNEGAYAVSVRFFKRQPPPR